MANHNPKYNTLKKYFYWNDKPYRLLEESRRKNIVIATDLIEQKRVQFPWNTWKRHKRPAFSTIQAAEILGRNHYRVRMWFVDGLLPRPFSVRDNPQFGDRQVNMIWSEKDLHRAREYMESTGRKDTPSKAELEAKINHDKLVQYVRDEETGEFIPVWVAP